MNSKILNALGIGSIDPMIFILVLIFLCIILFVLVIVLNIKLGKLSEKYEEFMKGKDMESMEELVMKRFGEMDKMLEDTNKNLKDIEMLFENMKSVVQKIGIVKYDAFNEMGGKLSFALAMLDGKNTGFVLNAMHSREGCYTYIKEIIKGESYIPLGAEEKKALEQAMQIISE
ncbi:MAG: DUF4446 family protein [Lachnospiraceae bacterium]|nr:DUF4446 family protein [Lachnospiraceae bacterium]